MANDTVYNLPVDFAELQAVYENDILPALQEQERHRVAAAAKSRQFLVIAVLAALVIAGGGFFIFRNPIPIVVGVVAGIGLGVFGSLELNQIRKKAKLFFVQPVAEAMGIKYAPTLPRPVTVHDFRSSRLLPSWDREKYEDSLKGNYHGTDFEMFEAHLEQKQTSTDSNGRTRTNWVTVFRGQCLRFDAHKEFHGETLILRDSGIFNRFGGKKGLKQAKLESSEFEKHFEVYTNDQVESRYILTPDLMARLVDLEKGLRGGDLKCAFVDQSVLITVDAGNLFEPGSLFEPFDNPDRLFVLLKDFSVVFNLIDQVTQSSSRNR